MGLSFQNHQLKRHWLLPRMVDLKGRPERR
jgi:hypothetical protein